MTAVIESTSPVSSDDIMSPEELALQIEITNLKVQLEIARNAVADKDFYEMTKSVVELDRLRFKIRKTLRGHLAKVTCVKWAADSRIILTAGQDGKMIIWDSYSANKVCMIPHNIEWLFACAISPSMHFVTSGGLDNIITVFSLANTEGSSAQLVKELHGHNGYISSLDYVDETKILSASGDKTLGLWDIEHLERIGTFAGHTNDINNIKCSKIDNNLVISVSSDYTCRAWDIRIAKCVQLFEGHEQDVNDIDFFPNGKAFATSSDDTSCRLWDMRADQAVAAYVDESIDCASNCVALSHSGRLLVAGYDDFNSHIWDVLREEHVGVMSAHDARVSSIAINGVGNSILTGSWDSTCYVWTAH